MKIVVLDGYTENPGDISWAPFEKLGELVVYDYTAPSEIFERLEGVSVCLTNKTCFPKEVLEKLPDLKYIGCLSTGFNVVDVEYCREHGITVTNIPEYATFATAQMTIALLLEISNKAGHHSDLVHEGVWTRGRDFCFWDGPLTELYGKTLGLFGFGKIASRVSRIASALGMKVLACRRSEITEEMRKADPQVTFTDEETLWKESDVISFHCPLTPATTSLVNEKAISKMKDGVILINTSRGPVLDEAAVAKALKSGKVAALGADVVSVEPIREDNPLLTSPNTVLTPHIAWAPKETRLRLMDVAAGNLSSYLKGSPVNVVS
ncbi:MAG: D-2-hydroxyacid dehydrogenase [Clostridiales bacterium]|nr:D-2-hydroxyacid dehydrogenase [Clostridiales bacterium]MBR4010622.1 D-2-hydroxyacid dehydrogenase [Clostridiales bacterium]